MELRQLRHLIAVLQRASFSGAANDLHITQPALSKSLRALEKSLGVSLIERGPSGVRPTVFGDLLATYAHLIVAQVTEAEQELEALRGARTGRLRIGASPAALRTIVPAAVRSFLESRPAAQLSVVEGLNEALIGSLRRGALDLIVTAMPSELFDPELEFRVLQQEQILIVGQPNHPLVAHDNVQIGDLVGYGWIVPERIEPDRRQLDRMFAAARLPAPNVVVETTSVTLLPSMLSETTYLSYLPASSVSALKGCSALRLESPTWSRTTAAAFRHKGPLRPLLGRFLQNLEAAAEASQ